MCRLLLAGDALQQQLGRVPAHLAGVVTAEILDGRPEFLGRKQLPKRGEHRVIQ